MHNDEEEHYASLFVDRLRAAMGDLSQAVVAKRARIATSTFSKILQGAEPGLFKAARIAEALDVSLEWLASGQGQPNGAVGGYLDVPIYDVRLAAGAATFVDGAVRLGSMPFDPQMLRSLGRTSAEGLAVLEAEGDSMEPLIPDGARVLADLKDTRLREGIFAFRLDDELRLKRLRRTTDGIEVLSENPRYEPELLHGPVLDRFAIIGRVLWAGSAI